jgi:hypothetical protein
MIVSLIIQLSVRGDLGQITVWHTEATFNQKQESKEQWSLLHSRTHPTSYRALRKLHLDVPVRLTPGESCGLYVHSASPGDSQIVYDNQRGGVTSSDECIEILPGDTLAIDHRFENILKKHDHGSNKYDSRGRHGTSLQRTLRPISTGCVAMVGLALAPPPPVRRPHLVRRAVSILTNVSH